jgi:NAD(P)-dependent dehydrogenase (short-subunit alcohol dehydrogenase family)
MRFRDKAVIVTGGASGIGRAAALAFAREGARVAVADKDAQGGERTVADLHSAGGEGVFMRCDVTSASDVEKLIERTVREFGRLDIGFNNAGYEGKNATTRDYSIEDFDRVIATNLRGVWLCMRYELARLNKPGVIVNTASIAGLVGFAEEPAYVASKHGIIGLTRTAALEVARDDIRINCVCPGAVATPMLSRSTPPDELGEYIADTPQRRVAKPEEIAAAVLWLCSPESAFMTGQTLTLDGGWTAQ